jgi:hypothetical protein
VQVSHALSQPVCCRGNGTVMSKTALSLHWLAASSEQLPAECWQFRKALCMHTYGSLATLKHDMHCR